METTQLTGYDGNAKLCYLRGKYLAKNGNNKEAVQQLNEALKKYAQVASKFEGKFNTVEVEAVKVLLSELKNGQ